MQAGSLFVVGFVVAFISILAAMRLAWRIELVDRPGGRKAHQVPIPVVGGIGFFLAFSVALPYCGIPPKTSFAMALAAAIVVGTGLWDDIKDVRALPKLALEAIAAGVMVAAGVELTGLGNLFGQGIVEISPVLAAPFTIFAVVGVMNAMNMTDGVDGLAGGLALIASVWLGLAAVLMGDRDCFLLLAALSGAIVAFLTLNMRGVHRKRASVFMGDAGSLFLGLVLGWMCVSLAGGSKAAPQHLPPIAALWILALPVTDTLAAMVRRIIRGKSPFCADREHLHHILLASGFSDRQVVALLLLASMVFGAFGIAGWIFAVPEYAMFVAYLVLFLAHLLFVLNSRRVVLAASMAARAGAAAVAAQPSAGVALAMEKSVSRRVV